MKHIGWIAIAVVSALGTYGILNNPEKAAPMAQNEQIDWKKKLTPEQYRILRDKGTEQAFTGKYWDLKDDGNYYCAGCSHLLFKSDTKFDSGCGWPSFYDVADKSNIEFHDDNSLGMKRIEVLCKNCKGHLGHVFNDGPNPTGLRYCINSGSLDFKPKEKK